MLPAEFDLTGVAGLCLILALSWFATARAEQSDRKVASVFFGLLWLALAIVLAVVVFGLAYKVHQQGSAP